MFFENSEEKAKKLDLKINELNASLQEIYQEIDSFLENNNISSVELDKYENKENFSDQEWELIVEIRKNLQEIIKKDLYKINNPNQVKKSYEELRLSSNWISMR